MKIFYSLATLLLLSCNQPKMVTKMVDGCPDQLVPVCGQPKMPKCPAGKYCGMVMPMPKTYKNLCLLNKNQAEFISNGACATF